MSQLFTFHHTLRIGMHVTTRVAVWVAVTHNPSRQQNWTNQPPKAAPTLLHTHTLLVFSMFHAPPNVPCRPPTHCSSDTALQNGGLRSLHRPFLRNRPTLSSIVFLFVCLLAWRKKSVRDVCCQEQTFFRFFVCCCCCCCCTIIQKGVAQLLFEVIREIDRKTEEHQRWD